METVRIFLVIVCFVAADRSTLFNRNLLNGNTDRVITIARQELGVREVSGKNDGKRVEEYLSAVGLKRGDPYCAAFVSWVFRQAGYPKPRTGWSPALFPGRLLVKEAKPGNVFGIWFPALKRVAHAGFVEREQGDFLQTIEANTNLKGSREGDGVYRKMRHRRSIYRFADWLLPRSTHLLNTSKK